MAKKSPPNGGPGRKSVIGTISFVQTLRSDCTHCVGSAKGEAETFNLCCYIRSPFDAAPSTAGNLATAATDGIIKIDEIKSRKQLKSMAYSVSRQKKHGWSVFGPGVLCAAN